MWSNKQKGKIKLVFKNDPVTLDFFLLLLKNDVYAIYNTHSSIINNINNNSLIKSFHLYYAHFMTLKDTVMKRQLNKVQSKILNASQLCAFK